MFGQAPAAPPPAAGAPAGAPAAGVKGQRGMRPGGAPGAFAAHEGGMFSGLNLLWWGLGGVAVLGAGYYFCCSKSSPLSGLAGLGRRPKRRRR